LPVFTTNILEAMMLNCRSICRSLVLPVLLQLFATHVQAQAGNFASVAIGQTSAPQTVTLTFTGAGTLATELALTQGADKQDFVIASGGSCATGRNYQVGSSCTVSVSFTPRYAGTRIGAVVLEDAGGSALASAYISGVGTGPQAGFHVATRQLTTFPNLTFAADRGIAVDGNGDLFAASINTSGTSESLVEIPAGCTTQSCVKQLPGTFTRAWGLAVDGAGNLWVGDQGANGSISEILAASGYSTAKTYTGSFGYQVGVAVDGAGNVYFTGGSNGSTSGVTELLASDGYTTSKLLATGYNTLGGIAVDSSGDVFFADPSSRLVKQIVAVNGSIPSTPTIKSLGSAILSLSGIALDGGGNLYALGNDSAGFGVIYELSAASGYSTVTELSNQTNPVGIAIDAGGNVFGAYYTNQVLGGISTNSIFELPRAAAPSLLYATPTAPGAIDSSDGPHRVLLESIGNQPLSLAGLKISNGNFSFDASTTTCTDSATLAVGDSCLLAIVFNPLTTGNITGTVAVTDNAVNGGSGTQSIALSGKSLYTPLVSATLASSVVAVTQALPVTVTVNGGSGNPTPTGTIQITAPGFSPAPLTLNGGSASITIPAGTLSPGQSSILSTYEPDAASTSNYTSASVNTTFVVTSTILNIPTVTVTPAVGSISLGQALTVTVSVDQVSGSPMPTGTVSLAGGNYTSTATPLSGGTVTITIPANSLIIGTDQLVATYTPDAASATIYVSAKGQGFVAVSAAATAPGATPADFGSIAIGKSSPTQAVTLTFPANSTPASLIATTQGAAGLDFATMSGGSCGVGINVAAGQSCTVNVTFTPAVAGLRNGAVIALDESGRPLATTYVHGSGTGPQVSIQSDTYYNYSGVFALNYPFSFTTLSDGFSRPNVAVDGAGNVFVADWGNQVVREIPTECTSASCTVTVMTGVSTPTAVAVDGAGNIFVTEAGYGDVKKIPPGCKSPSCMQTVGSGFNQPYGLAVDSSGNIFVADTNNNAVKEVLAEGGYSTIKTLASGLDLPWSVVVNANGDLFVAEGGDQCTTFIPGTCSAINTSLLEFTAASGYQTVKTIASGVFGKPLGLAIDGSGNVYVADYGDGCATEFPAGSGFTTAHRLCSGSLFIYPEGLAVDGRNNVYLDDVIRGSVYKLNYADIPPMTFKTATLQGVSDVQDGSQVVSVQNNGTAPLTFSSISLSDTSFKINSTVNTCSTSTPLAVGASCYLAVDFAPTKTGPINATLTLTDNNLNQSSATQVIQIGAVALPPMPVILTDPVNPTTATTATFTFSDTQTPVTFVCSIDSLPFSACDSPAAYPTLSGGPHVFQVKAKDFAGNLSLAAVYNWTVSSVGPPAPVITSAPAYLTNDDTATFAFTDSQSGVSYQCSLDGAAFAACTSGVNYSGMAGFANNYTIVTKRHSFAVKAMDGSGNFSPETTRAWTAISTPFSAYPLDFGLVPVGQTSSPQSVSFNVTTAATVATINALTMGVSGLDFTVTDPGTCAVGTTLSKGSTCTLKATFTPKYPGQRKGGVLLLDASGNGVGEAYVQGTGTAPQVTFTPYSTVTYNILALQNNTDAGQNLSAPVSAVTVDGAGSVYVADTSISSADQSVSVSTGDIWKFPAGCTGPSCSTLVATERNATPSTAIPLILPTSLQMDGAGVLWLTNFALWPANLPTVGLWSPTECSYIPTFNGTFLGIAVDGAGNAAMTGNGVIQSCYKNLGLGQTTQTTSFDLGSSTPAITIDPQGNFFVADTSNNAVKEVLASSNYTIDRSVGSGFSKPGGVATDAFGNIYVSDSGNNAIKEIVAASGYTQVLTLATFDPKVLTPQNLTVDALGNVYIAPSNVNTVASGLAAASQFIKLDFSDAPALAFPTDTKIGTTDTTDGTLTATVKNNGNQPLIISSLALSNTNFSIDAGATTCSTSAPLAVGASCAIGVQFTPNGSGALSGTLTLTDNALNDSGATQQFALSGTAFTTPTAATPTVLVTPASSSITTAQSNAITVAVSGASGRPIPTGTVSLVGGSYTSAVVTLSGGAATFTIPAGVLAVGSTTLNAIYSPDAASSATYGTGAGSTAITVTATSASTPIVSVTPAAINVSTQQSLTVTLSVVGNPTPTGSVTLSGGNYSSLATVLSSGRATIVIPAGYLPAGTITLTAYYTPDLAGQANYTSSSGTGQVAVSAAAKTTPTVTVTPASSSIATNQPLQVTMQVSGNGKSAPTGTIVLSSGSYISAAAALSQGNVILNIPAGALAAGVDSLTASYTPDNSSSLTFNAATGTGSVSVSTPLVSTVTVLQASAASGAFGDSVTLSATVTPASRTVTPTGSVTLMDGASSLATLLLNASGTASYSTTALAVGSHSITAVYAGDSNNSASTSTPVAITVIAPAPVASLAPTSLSFASVVGTTTTGQPIALTNIGNAPLNITSISIAGSGAGSFTQTNTCGTALAAGTNCTIAVTFTPGSVGTFSATLSVADNASGAPQTVTLSGTGTPAPSFTLSTTASTQSVKSGGTAIYTITATPQNGAFNNAVVFTVSGLPPGATATFQPSTLTPGSAPASTQLTIQTAAATAQGNTVPLWPAAGPVLALIGIGFLPGKRRQRWLTLGFLFLAALGALTMGGCGGGFSLGAPSARTYTVTVSGTSGSEVQTTTIQLTVE
jgi:large repetitive protein